MQFYQTFVVPQTDTGTIWGKFRIARRMPLPLDTTPLKETTEVTEGGLHYRFWYDDRNSFYITGIEEAKGYDYQVFRAE